MECDKDNRDLASGGDVFHHVAMRRRRALLGLVAPLFGGLSVAI